MTYIPDSEEFKKKILENREPDIPEWLTMDTDTDPRNPKVPGDSIKMPNKETPPPWKLVDGTWIPPMGPSDFRPKEEEETPTITSTNSCGPIEWTPMGEEQSVIRINIPTYVGQYSLGGKGHTFCISFEHKPSFIKRFLMKHLLGFYWEDTK